MIVNANEPNILNLLVEIPLATQSSLITGIILSENPIRYKEILKAVAIKMVNPIAPPIGNPRLLVNI